MNLKTLILLYIFFIALVYLGLTAIFLFYYYRKFAKPFNNALKLLFISSFFGFSINLFQILKQAIVFLHANQLTQITFKEYAIIGVFAILAFIFALLILKISEYLIKIAFSEDFHYEIIQNNYLVVGINAILFIFLNVLSSNQLVSILFNLFPFNYLE